MKGKGQLPSYWLEASDLNESVNAKALEKLDAEIMKEVKGIKDQKQAHPVVDNRGLKSLEEHIDAGSCKIDNYVTEKVEIDDSKS
mmetsp:Transcript_79538/g.156068  ORF Transcript_79538/g.156068 Transcript_79538/m.156068 type:complete len:85 (-) Transcript_79538:18-272(-)